MRGTIYLLTLLFVACGPTYTAPNNDNNTGPEVRLPPEETPTAAACGDVPESGECQGSLAVYCNAKDNELRQKDCGLMDKTCGIDPDRGAVCLTPTSSEETTTCPENLTAAGECTDSGTATFCLDGVQTIICEDATECGFDQFGLANCIPTEDITSGCGDVTVEGECDTASSYIYCDEGEDEVVSIECSSGDACVISSNIQYAICEDPCGGITNVGQCDGDTLSFCSYVSLPSNLVVQECTGGTTCQNAGDDEAPYYNCVE
jgi:hypothetical protein